MIFDKNLILQNTTQFGGSDGDNTGTEDGTENGGNTGGSSGSDNVSVDDCPDRRAKCANECCGEGKVCADLNGDYACVALQGEGCSQNSDCQPGEYCVIKGMTDYGEGLLWNDRSGSGDNVKVICE